MTPLSVPIPFKTVVLVQNQETDPGDKLLTMIQAYLSQYGIAYSTSVLASRNATVVPPVGINPDVIMILGGDGTFLRAARCFAHTDTPLVGVNTGHLGFLTRIEANRATEYLDALRLGRTTIETRMMLNVRYGACQKIESQEAPSSLDHALNDVVIKNANPSRLASLNVLVDNHPLASYDADGVIIATPTGSTAYNLSAGGPIMDPTADTIAITPVCPHSLSAKPIVLPANRTLTIESDAANSGPLVCAIDGDDVFTLAPGERFLLVKSQTALPLITFTDEPENFYNILKRKLGWSNNPRSIAKTVTT